MFFVAHYTLVFDSRAAAIPSPVMFGIGFNGHVQPTVGFTIPEPTWRDGVVHFKFGLGDRTLSVKKAVLHPSVTGIELHQGDIPLLTLPQVAILHMHVLTCQVEVHCANFADAVRQRNAAHAHLQGLITPKTEGKALGGVAYVLPLKADPKE